LLLKIHIGADAHIVFVYYTKKDYYFVFCNKTSNIQGALDIILRKKDQCLLN